MIPERDRSDAPHPLPHGTTAVLRGSTFALSDERGDVVPGSAWGIFHRDTRMLSKLVLEIDGQRPGFLSNGKSAPHAARFFTALHDPPGRLSIRRRRVVGDDVLEDVTIESHRTEPSRLVVTVHVDADFADLFEVKDGGPVGSYAHLVEDDDGSIRYRNTRAGLDLRTRVTFSEPPMIRPGVATWVVALEPGHSWSVTIRVSWGEWSASNGAHVVEVGASQLDEPERRAAEDLEGWISSFPRLSSDDETLVRMYRRSIEDLAALRLPIQVGEERLVLPAAGLPWFMTIFGRDTLLTAYESLPFAPALAKGALKALASLQGDRSDDRHDEDPGKMLHEIRSGPLTLSGELPYDPYFGSVDATPLWLVLLSEYERWTGDGQLVAQLWPNALRALDWIEANLERSRTGYVEYETRSPVGLANQGWKDSWDAISFHDGTIAEPPIALVEVQGYVVDAWLRTADLARRVIGDRRLARSLRVRANRLRSRLDRDFWLEDREGFYAMGVDRDRRPIDSITSNMGHLLWSGVVPARRIPVVVDRLFSPSLWSGWGIRTMSTEEAGYDPLGYHVGTIWPHDNAVIADGLGRVGRWDAARRIAHAMIAAAHHQNAQLPEAFAGYDRGDSLFPVRYPMASSPQAWATASTFVWIKTLMGLRAEPGLRWTVDGDAHGWVHLDDVSYRGNQIDVHVPDGAGRDRGWDPRR